MKIAITAIAAVAGAATASPYFQGYADAQQVGSAPAGALATITIDLSGANSWDSSGAAVNERYDQNLLANAHIVGLGFDVSITTSSNGSWYSEAVIAFENTAQTAGVFLTPGIGDDFNGSTALSYSSGGIIDLATVLPSTPLDFFLDADGVLRVELFEGFDDVAGDIDAFYGAGSTVQVQYVIPAPGALAVLGMGGLVAGRRRR